MLSDLVHLKQWEVFLLKKKSFEQNLEKTLAVSGKETRRIKLGIHKKLNTSTV